MLANGGGYGGSLYHPRNLRRVWNTGQAVGRAAKTISRVATKYLKRKAQRQRQGGGKKVRTEERMHNNLVVQEGSSTSKSVHDFGSRKSYAKDVTRLCAPQFYLRNDAGVNVQSSVGAQTTFAIGHYTYGDLNAIKNLSPNTPLITSRVLLEYMEAELVMANASVYTTCITIYDVIARRDLATVSVRNPDACFNNGLLGEGAGASGYAYVGAEPFQSEQFNQYYKVLGKTKFDLPSGGTHRHIVKFRPNKVLHNEVMANSVYGAGSTNDGGIADLTVFSLVVMHGQPAHDSTTITSVTLSAASIDYIHKCSYRFRFLQDSATTWSKSNNLATSFAVGPQVVNDLVGQVQDSGGLHPGTLLS